MVAAPTCERAPMSRCDMRAILTTRFAGSLSRHLHSTSANMSARGLGHLAAPCSPRLSEPDNLAAAWQAGMPANHEG